MDERPKLRDLYKVREPVEFPNPVDPDGDPVRVWVVKLNVSQMEAVERKAGAARALALMQRDDPNSELFLAHMAELMMLPDPNDAVPFIVGESAQQRRLSIVAEHATTGTWGKDNLYETLVDAWKGDGDGDSLESIWASFPAEDGRPPEDPDQPNLGVLWDQAQQVYAKLTKFNDEVNELYKHELDDMEAQHKIEPGPDGEFDPDEAHALLRKAAKVFVEAHAADLYWTEFARQRAFYATRQRDTAPDENGIEVPGPEIRKRYFGELEDYDDCDDVVKEMIRQAYDQMSVTGMAGKEQPEATSSSSPSDSPETPEASPDSGPMASTA